MKTTILVIKKTNSHKVNQNLHRGTKFYSKQKPYYSLQDTFDETCETYLEQNPGMEIAEAKRKTFDELKSNYMQALISNYHDLVQLGNILKKDPIHKQIMATAKRLRSEEDYDLAES